MPAADLARRAARVPSKWARTFKDRAVHGREIRELVSRSMLAPANRETYALESCPVCSSPDIVRFFEMPFGFPEGQNHSLMYFDYREVDLGEIARHRTLLDRAMGLVARVPWVFCNGCTATALDIVFPQGHLDHYYSELYERSQPMHPNRRRTKELHGEFLASKVPAAARILEVGAAEGFTSEYLVRRGFNVIASELSEEHEGKLRGIDGLTVAGDIAELPEGAFDCVFAHHVLEHVSDPEAFVALAARLLAGGGILLVQVPDVSLQLMTYVRYLRRSPVNLVNPYRLDLSGVHYDFAAQPPVFCWLDALLNDHVVAYTPEALASLCERAELTVESVDRSTLDTVTIDAKRYSWPVDETTGSPPNGLTVIARKSAAGGHPTDTSDSRGGEG